MIIRPQGLLESEYHVDIEGQPDQDLLMLTRLLCSTDKPRKCLQPVSLQDCSTEELVFLTRLNIKLKLIASFLKHFVLGLRRVALLSIQRR